MEGFNLKEVLSELQLRKNKRPRIILEDGYSEYVLSLVSNIGSELVSGEFVIDDNNKQVINNLVYYFVGDHSFPGNLSNGLLMIGGLGTGKTTLLKIFGEILRGFKIPNWTLRTIKCVEIVELWETSGWDRLEKFKKGIWCFDDLGEENLEAHHYGSQHNVMGKILSDRYEKWQDTGLITHISTNYTPALLESKYGDRVTDRIIHMSNAILFDKQINRRHDGQK